jgi:hypothetical protein
MCNDRRQISGEELQVFSKLIGSGIWCLQHVEDVLSTYITVKAEFKERRGPTADNAERLLSKHRRNTLGTSIRIAKDRQVHNPELLAMLETFKVERDSPAFRKDDTPLNRKPGGLMEQSNASLQRGDQG